MKIFVPPAPRYTPPIRTGRSGDGSGGGSSFGYDSAGAGGVGDRVGGIIERFEGGLC